MFIILKNNNNTKQKKIKDRQDLEGIKKILF